MPGYATPDPPSERDVERGLNRDLDRSDRKSRIEAAVALRIAGATYADIAKALDYANSTRARQAVEKALAASVGTDQREQLRFLEGRRLERLLRGLWRKATDEKSEEHLAAARTALAVIDRHARLYGLDAPQQMVVYTPAGHEISEWVSAMVAQVKGELPQEADIIESYTVDDDVAVGDDA